MRKSDLVFYANSSITCPFSHAHAVKLVYTPSMFLFKSVDSYMLSRIFSEERHVGHRNLLYNHLMVQGTNSIVDIKTSCVSNLWTQARDINSKITCAGMAKKHVNSCRDRGALCISACLLK